VMLRDVDRLMYACREILRVDSEPIRDKQTQDQLASRLLLYSMKIGELREVLREIENQR
jgi:hypothetical protein